MTHRPLRLATAATALLTVAACVAACSNSSPDARDGAASISSCGHTVTIDSPPERVVVQPHNLAEVLAALDLVDRIVGYSAFGPFTPAEDYAEELADLPQLGTGPLSREVVASKEPDLLYSQINYGDSMVEDYGPLDIPVLFTTMYCPEHAPQGADGEPSMLESRYQDIEDLGRIFQVQDKAADVVDDLRGRMTAVEDSVNGEDPVRVAAVGFLSGTDGPLSANGGTTLTSELIEAAGGINVYEALPSDTATEVGIETLVDHAPDVIVVLLMMDSDFEDTREFLLNDPRFADIPAVQNDRITFIYNEELFAGIRFPDAAARFADFFHHDN